MSLPLLLLLIVGGLLLILVFAAMFVVMRNSGRPRMTKWERLAIARQTNKHLERKAAEAAFKTQAEAMGYDLADLESEE